MGETSWQFVAVFDASDDAVLPGYGVVYWAFVGRYYADRWPDSHEALIHAAETAVPMASDIERRIATYGPFTGRARSMHPPFERVDDDVDEDTQHARFQFRLIEAVHEATLGRHVTRGDVALPAMPGWTAGYEIGLDTFQDVLNSPELNGPMPS